MHISIKNTHGLDTKDLDTISYQMLQNEFRKLVRFDIETREEDAARLVVELTTNVFFIRHSEFALSKISQIDLELHLASVERYGLFDMFQIGTDTNKTSVLYWVVIPKGKEIMSSSLGLVTRNTQTMDKPDLLARFDHLWIAGNRVSSVLAVNSGSSHMIT